MQRPDERELREELARLRAEHRDLDAQIVEEEASAHADQLLIKRLKKRKLTLKDRITAIEDQLVALKQRNEDLGSKIDKLLKMTGLKINGEAVVKSNNFMLPASTPTLSAISRCDSPSAYASQSMARSRGFSLSIARPTSVVVSLDPAKLLPAALSMSCPTKLVADRIMFRRRASRARFVAIR